MKNTIPFSPFQTVKHRNRILVGEAKDEQTNTHTKGVPLAPCKLPLGGLVCIFAARLYDNGR